MTKQEQIEEMAKIVDEIYNVYTTTADDIAEGIYNAGYRKIREKDETLEKQIKHLNTIVERLDELLGKGINDYIMGIDGVEGIKDMWERSAVREFAGKVKEYINDNADFVYKSECGEYAEINITLCEKYIDELLKEYE